MLEIAIFYIIFSIVFLVFLLFKGYKDWEIVFWSFILIFGLGAIITRILELLIVIIPAITIYAIYKYNVHKKTKSDENLTTKENLNNKEFDLNKSITLQEDIIRSNIIFFFYRNKKFLKNEWSTPVERYICGHKVVYYDVPHKYFIDGIEVPSITDMVGVLAIYYGWDDYKKINPNVLENAAKKGTMLHKAIEQYEEFGIENETIEFCNYLKVKNEQNFRVLENENIVILKIDDKPIAIGRFDMIISLNGSICLTEIKRTSKLYKDKVSLQLNLYRLAYLQCFRDKNIEKLKVIRLYNDKKQFVDIDVDEQKAIDAVKKYYEIYEKFIRDAV